MAEAVYHGYTPEQLQRQYSARAAVPEHPAIFERWRAESAAWRREAPAAWLGLRYGGRPRQCLDLFHPDGTTAAPLHVFFHGGYWQALGREDFSFVARGLNAHGIAVAVVGYSLCPEVTVAAIVDEARAAVAWLHDHRDALRLDARPLQLSGHSAGGQLVAMLAATGSGGAGATDATPSLDWIAPISGVFDLEPLVHTAINEALGLDPTTARAASPLGRVPASAPAIDAWVGAEESEEFRRQSETFVERWAAAAASAELHRLPGCNHFTVLEPLFASDGPLVRTAQRRLDP